MRNSSKFKSFLIVANIALLSFSAGMIGIIAQINIKKDNVNEVIEIANEEEIVNTKEIICNNLNPGQEKRYIITISSFCEGVFDALFYLSKPEGELLQYLDVSIGYKEDLKADHIAINSLNLQPVHFEMTFKKMQKGALIYILSIDETYGNEVENKNCSFNINMKLTKKGKQND